MFSILKEFDRLSFAGRPDGSGVRGQGMKRPALKRASDYPYDRLVFYGSPQAYDRGSGGDSGGLHLPITPRDTSHSAWDSLSAGPDDVEEAMGVPFNVAMADNSGMGAATGIPGADGGWANGPRNPWDEDDREETLDLYADPDEEPPWARPGAHDGVDVAEGYQDATNYTFDPRTPEPEPVPNAKPPYFHDMTDDDLERKVDRLYDRPSSDGDPGLRAGAVDFPSDIMVIGGSGFGMGLGAPRNSRYVRGLIPKESAWDALESISF